MVNPVVSKRQMRQIIVNCDACQSIDPAPVRKGCSIAEAVYLYNVTPRNDRSEPTAPADAIYKYKVGIHNVDSAAEGPHKPGNPYGVGNPVWVKPHGARYDPQYTRGTVTRILSSQAAEIDNIPHHVRDLHRRAVTEEKSRSKSVECSTNDGMSTLVLATGRVKKTVAESGCRSERSGQDVRRDDREPEVHCTSASGLEQTALVIEERTDNLRTDSDSSEVLFQTLEKIPWVTPRLPPAMSNSELRRSSQVKVRPRRNRVSML
uniref:Uncharacterized protein n=1 Tax=Trichuris muris TaxID=70415 RepID=A0A5S6QGS5_TRIMR